jgi:hypothetical protein
VAKSDEALQGVAARASADRSHPQGVEYSRAARAIMGLPPEAAPPPVDPRQKKERAPRERAPDVRFEPKMGQAQLSFTPGGVRLDEQRPELKRLKLTSPIKVELDGAEGSVSLYVHAARDQNGVIQVTPMHPFAAGDVIASDVVAGLVVMGPWTIPVSEFAPGSSSADGPSRLVAGASGNGFKRWTVASDPTPGKSVGFFAGLKKRGIASIRLKGGTVVGWDFEAHPPAQLRAIAPGAALHFNLGWDGERLFAKDVDDGKGALEVTPAEAPTAATEGAPGTETPAAPGALRDVLFPGLASAPAPEPKAAPAEPRRELPKREAAQESLSPSAALHLVDGALLRGERHALDQLSQARISEKGEQELFEKVRWNVASSAGRWSNVTSVVVARLTALKKAQTKRQDDGSAHELVYLHTTVGEAKPLGDPGRDKAPEDPVARLLRSSPAGSPTQAADAFFRRHPLTWNVTLALGELGYRIVEVAVRRGMTELVLAAQTTEPNRLALAFAYEEGFETREAVESFLRQHSSKREAMLLFATRVGGLHAANYESLAARHGAAFLSARQAPEAEALTALLASAKANAGTVPAPVRAFPVNAANLQESQVVPRPEVVTNLLAALDADKRPVAVYGMRRSGRTALARLLGMQCSSEPTIVDLRPRAREFASDPSGLVAWLRGLVVASPDRSRLLVLDSIDTLSAAVGAADAALATEFSAVIAEAASTMRVLCLGLDPTAVAHVAPTESALVDLPRFRLPYLSQSEATELVRRMASPLRVDGALESWLVAQSGGHPGVLRALLAQRAEAQFGKDVARVPTQDALHQDAAFAASLLGEAGAARRADALAPVLGTRDAASVHVADAWRLATEVLTALPESATTEDVLAAGARLSPAPASHPSVLLETLLDWGLLRSSGGRLEAGIPLLATHLKLEASGGGIAA